MIDDGLLPFIDRMDPDGSTLIQAYLDARKAFSKVGLIRILSSLNSLIASGDTDMDGMFKDKFSYGLGGGAMDEVGAAAWQSIASPLAALSALRTDGGYIEVSGDETQETIDMLEELREMNKLMTARAQISS